MQLKGKDADLMGIEIDKNDTFTGDGVKTNFGLTANIEPNSEVVVKVDGSEQDSSGYTIDYVNRQIIFDTAPIDTASISVDYKGWSYPVTSESCTDISGTYEEYQIDAQSKRILDIFQTVTVYVDSTSQSKSDYSINPFTGVIKFNEPLTDSNVVTVDISYVKIIELGRLYGWELNMSAERVDGAIFREEHKNEVPIYATFSGSADGYHIDPYFAQYTDFDSKAYIAQFWLDYNNYYAGWVHIDLDISTSKDDLIKETVNFSGYRHLERNFQ